MRERKRQMERERLVEGGKKRGWREEVFCVLALCFCLTCSKGNNHQPSNRCCLSPNTNHRSSSTLQPSSNPFSPTQTKPKLSDNQRTTQQWETPPTTLLLQTTTPTGFCSTFPLPSPQHQHQHDSTSHLRFGWRRCLPTSTTSKTLLVCFVSTTR